MKKLGSFSLLLIASIDLLVGCSTEPTEPDPMTADLAVAKSDAVDPVNVDDEIVYTITITNNGPEAADGVTLTDVVPPGTSFVSALSSQGTCGEAAGTVTCSVGILASGSGATVTLTLRADGEGLVTNTAIVSGDVQDPNLANNAASETTSVEVLEADLSVSKTDEDNSVLVGDDIVYTIIVENDGPGDATGVELTDDVPALTSFVSAIATQGDCSEASGSVTCDLGDLASGASATITLTVLADEPGEVTNTAAVSANEHDPDETNNSDTESTIIQGPPSDLAITKVDEEDPVALGDDIVYTITALNEGPNAATSVIVTDEVPLGTSFVSAVASQGDCTEESGLVTCSLGSLLVDGEATVTLTVEAEQFGQVENTAEVTGSVQDGDSSNNSDTETTTVTALADLSIEKDDEDDPVDLGDLIVYELVVTNHGPDIATDVVVTDEEPDGVTFEEVIATGGNCDEARDLVTCELGDMAPGDSVTITISYEAEVIGRVTNFAEVESDVTDPDLSNNEDVSNTDVRGPEADLEVTKADQADPVTVGDNIVYTINVVNNGPASATNITVTDDVPANTTYVSATISSGSCSESGGTVTCDPGTLNNGVGATITLTVTADAAGQVSNTATVSSPSVEDPDGSNDSATESTTVNAAP
jgi:uncharacterized repeat protein (TIGR01451 family)